MSLSFELKKTNPDIKRNVKFDEDNLNLFMDLQTKKDGPWKRVLPDQAAAAMAGRKKKTDVLRDMATEELTELLGDDDTDKK